MTVSQELILWPSTGLAIAALWRGRRMLRPTWPETAAEVLTPILLGLLAVGYFNSLLLNTRWGWSACRLAPAIGLFHGYPLYSAIARGPINGWLYGPVAALAWTPAGLADSPFPALFIAASINLVFLLLPLAAASLLFARAPGPPRLLAFVIGAASLLLIYPTWYMVSVLNADAIAVGLGVGSCLILLPSRGPGAGRLFLGALLATLAAWTKQLEAPLALAEFAWLWICFGRRPALKFGVFYSGSMLAFGAVIFSLMDPRSVVFNMWTVPASQTLVGGWAAARMELSDFLEYTVFFLLSCLTLLLPAAKPASGASPPAGGSAIGLLLAAAGSLLPLGIVATIKIGGDRNSMHSVYYLVAAATVALARAWSAGLIWEAPRRCAVGLAAAALAFLAARQVAGYPNLTMLPSRCLSQESWVFAKEHPGQAYFPWDTLCTLMAEGRIYPFEYGIRDRILAGHAPAESRVREDLPIHLTSVIYPRAETPRLVVTRYLPEYGFAAAVPDWLIYRKKAEK